MLPLILIFRDETEWTEFSEIFEKYDFDPKFSNLTWNLPHNWLFYTACLTLIEKLL